MLFLSGWSCEIHGTWENCDISLQWRMCCGPLWSVVRVIHANSIQRFYFWQNSFNFWGNLLNDATCKECTCYIRISYWNTFITGTWNMEKRNGNSWLPRLWVKWRRTLMMFAKISWPLWTGCMSMPAPDLMDWVRHFNWSKIIGVRLRIKKKSFHKIASLVLWCWFLSVGQIVAMLNQQTQLLPLYLSVNTVVIIDVYSCLKKSCDVCRTFDVEVIYCVIWSTENLHFVLFFRLQNPVGPPVSGWVPVWLDHLHGLLHSGTLSTGRGVWWQWEKPCQHQVKIFS